MARLVKENHETIINHLYRSGYTINEVAQCLDCNRRTVRTRKDAPMTFTLQEITKLAVLLNKSPLAVAKILLSGHKGIDQIQDVTRERLMAVHRNRVEGKLKRGQKRGTGI